MIPRVINYNEWTDEELIESYKVKCMRLKDYVGKYKQAGSINVPDKDNPPTERGELIKIIQKIDEQTFVVKLGELIDGASNGRIKIKIEGFGL